MCAVFVAIGHKPIDIFSEVNLNLITRDTSRNMMTKLIDGYFVAGDVYDYIYRQAVTGAGLCCKAAIDAIKYLESKQDKE